MKENIEIQPKVFNICLGLLRYLSLRIIKQNGNKVKQI